MLQLNRGKKTDFLMEYKPPSRLEPPNDNPIFINSIIMHTMRLLRGFFGSDRSILPRISGSATSVSRTAFSSSGFISWGSMREAFVSELLLINRWMREIQLKICTQSMLLLIELDFKCTRRAREPVLFQPQRQNSVAKKNTKAHIHVHNCKQMYIINDKCYSTAA